MKQTYTKEYNIYPVLPIRDLVVFPKMVSPLFVGRAKSIKAIEQTSNPTTEILLVTQKDALNSDPSVSDFFNVGVLAKIIQTLRLPDGTVKVLVEARVRAKLVKIIESDGYFQAVIEKLEDSVQNKDAIEVKALMKSVIAEFQEYAKYNLRLNHEVFNILEELTDPGHLSDVIAANLSIGVPKKQELLEITDVGLRLKKLLFEIEYEISLLKTEQKIREDVKKQMEKTQKEYFLNEQLKAIHKELGDGKDGGKNEIDALEEKIEEKLKNHQEAYDKAKSELRKLKLSNSMSAEAAIIRNYLDYLLALPWGQYSELKHDIKGASKILDRDHYGLEEVKERILDLLAVQKRTDSKKGAIMCLIGPPGVGKTSLARSIAEATGRAFIKISLGGVRDEAEIRGHRRTYLGAMPGKLIYAHKKAGNSNPLVLLDEIDKLGSDWRGDPSAALLEVLDPEQNSKFSDHYLDIEYDLSKTMFVTTANSTNIPKALLDRMEVIRIPGYTEAEKLHIAKDYILNKVMDEHKISKKEMIVEDAALLKTIQGYTKEAGVRSLEREITKIIRKVVRAIEGGAKRVIKITESNLKDYLGVAKFTHNSAMEADAVGVTTGLAYTDFGGDLLSIESVVLPGDGKIKATGKLGDVMQESVSAAYSYLKANCALYGIDPEFLSKKDIHVHVPEGAIPKDGPSAGVAIFISILSALTGIPADKTVAMTGEITLRGRVLAIGGLKEKLLAAARGGIKTVLIPEENERHLSEIKKSITKDLQIVLVQAAHEAAKLALVGGGSRFAHSVVPADACGMAEHQLVDISHSTPGLNA